MKIPIKVSVKYGNAYPWPLEKHLSFVHISTSSQKAGRDTFLITQFQVLQFQTHALWGGGGGEKEFDKNEKSAEFSLAEMEAQEYEGGGRTLASDVTGGGRSCWGPSNSSELESEFELDFLLHSLLYNHTYT
jgi:hypothetical protein